MKVVPAAIAALAALGLAIPASVAIGQPAPEVPSDAQAAVPPAQSCFFTRDIRNETIGGNHTIYFNVRNRDTYRVEVKGPCLAAAGPSDRVRVESRGAGGQICDRLDIDVSVHGGRCIVDSIAKMTPQEIAAMPRRSDPQSLTPGFHLKPNFGRPQ